jgi:hypothetical protein
LETTSPENTVPKAFAGFIGRLQVAAASPGGTRLKTLQNRQIPTTRAYAAKQIRIRTNRFTGKTQQGGIQANPEYDPPRVGCA